MFGKAEYIRPFWVDMFSFTEFNIKDNHNILLC